MTNNLHHLKAGIKTVFLSLGLGYHHIQIIGLEFLQRCGHQIRVNTWTGSYISEYPSITKSQFEHKPHVALQHDIISEIAFSNQFWVCPLQT